MPYTHIDAILGSIRLKHRAEEEKRQQREAEIRRIVREELERMFPERKADSASDADLP